MDKTPTDKLTDAQLKTAITTLEGVGCKDTLALVQQAEGTPSDDAREWAEQFRRAALSFEKHGPGGSIAIALLPRYRELLAEEAKRQAANHIA